MTTMQNNVVYYTKKIHDELCDFLNDVLLFSFNHYGEGMNKSIEMILSKYPVSQEGKDVLFRQFIWLVIFCYPSKVDGMTIYQEYISHHQRNIRTKSIKLQEILMSWSQLMPGFYRVIESGRRTGKVFLFQDIFSDVTKVVCYYGRKMETPRNGDFVTGLLIPFNEAIYITGSRLLHFSDYVSEVEKIEQIGDVLCSYVDKEVLNITQYIMSLEKVFKHINEEGNDGGQ